MSLSQRVDILKIFFIKIDCRCDGEANIIAEYRWLTAQTENILKKNAKNWATIKTTSETLLVEITVCVKL